MGLFKSAFRPVKTDPAQRDLTFPIPPPTPPRKTIHNLPKTPPHQDFLITNVLTQGQIPWSVPVYELSAQTSQRIRVREEWVTTCLHRQEHETKSLLPSGGNNNAAFPTPNTTRRVPPPQPGDSRPVMSSSQRVLSRQMMRNWEIWITNIKTSNNNRILQ
jgi:hypothetical protein